MLDGTDLYSAYQPFMMDKSVELQVPPQPELPPSYSGATNSGATAINSIDYPKERYDGNGIYQLPVSEQQQNTKQSIYSSQQVVPEQKISTALNNYKAQKQSTQETYTSNQTNDGYFDKLFGKKRDFFKFIQLALIIVLGLSIHFIIKFYLQTYLNQSDLSVERQLVLRLLYPLGILFILWNMKAFVL